MKVISLQQPWAHFLVTGHKVIETRSWNTTHRGPILIHASKRKPTKRDLDLYMKDEEFAFHREICPDLSQLTYGAIIGRVNIVCTERTDVWLSMMKDMNHRLRQSPFVMKNLGDNGEWKGLWRKEVALGDFRKGRWGWECDNPEEFLTPIPASGKLGMWEWPHEVPSNMAISTGISNDSPIIRIDRG